MSLVGFKALWLCLAICILLDRRFICYSVDLDIIHSLKFYLFIEWTAFYRRNRTNYQGSFSFSFIWCTVWRNYFLHPLFFNFFIFICEIGSITTKNTIVGSKLCKNAQKRFFQHAQKHLFQQLWALHSLHSTST